MNNIACMCHCTAPCRVDTSTYLDLVRFRNECRPDERHKCQTSADSKHSPNNGCFPEFQYPLQNTSIPIFNTLQKAIEPVSPSFCIIIDYLTQQFGREHRY